MTNAKAISILTEQLGTGFDFAFYSINRLLNFTNIAASSDVFVWDGADLLDLKEIKDPDASVMDALKEMAGNDQVRVVYIRRYRQTTTPKTPGTPSNGISVYL